MKNPHFSILVRHVRPVVNNKYPAGLTHTLGNCTAHVEQAARSIRFATILDQPDAGREKGFRHSQGLNVTGLRGINDGIQAGNSKIHDSEPESFLIIPPRRFDCSD